MIKIRINIWAGRGYHPWPAFFVVEYMWEFINICLFLTKLQIKVSNPEYRFNEISKEMDRDYFP